MFFQISFYKNIALCFFRLCIYYIVILHCVKQCKYWIKWNHKLIFQHETTFKKIEINFSISSILLYNIFVCDFLDILPNIRYYRKSTYI